MTKRRRYEMSFVEVGNNKKSVSLVNRSTGKRGERGYYKGYRIDVFPGTQNDLPVWYVTVRWGRTEQNPSWWQVQVKDFQTEQQAMKFAWEKYYAKIDNGYEVYA
jgi:hypothetical protein